MTEVIGHWHWWILAAILIILEVFAPGAFFLWLGISAAVVGGVTYISPEIDWEYQLLLFSVLAVVSIVAWRKYFRSKPEPAWPALCGTGLHP